MQVWEQLTDRLKMARQRGRNGRRLVVRTWQLATRGWADQDTWSLDVTLCERLAAQLDHLADHTHGFPAANSEFPTMEAWQAALHENAAKIRAWALEDQSPGTPEQTKVTYARTQEGLTWVTDHLCDLWD